MTVWLSISIAVISSGFFLANWWLLEKLRQHRRDLHKLAAVITAEKLADGRALIRLDWVADIPVARMVAGSPLQAALWLHQIKDGVLVDEKAQR